MAGIVVGIDGSPNSQRALDWAMHEAAARHAALTVVAVHEVSKGYWSSGPVIGAVDDGLLAQLRQSAEAMTAKSAAALGDGQPASVNVHAVSGFAAKELIDASQDADLVVVGSRGGGGFARLLMGSVSSQVIDHSACPVVVVPHDR
jgi:nucleotide-binding universal stress UspA family protein